MRVALIAESFLPHMNGVTGTVLQMLRHLDRRGHEVLVLAPGPGRAGIDSARLSGAGFAGYRSVGWPGYPEVRIGLAAARTLQGELAAFRPDVVHLAAPFVLGWQGLRAAVGMGIPTVAIYQTDLVGFAARYRLPGTEGVLERHLARVHNQADRTLAPSSAAIASLEALGVRQVHRWGRGVDAELFRPDRRDHDLRARLAPGGETVVGYVGRLAPEKQVEDLAVLSTIPGIRLVVVGDGPVRPQLERVLPRAAFLGHLSGTDLARAVASLDVFVHPGEHETFCQTVQEALASGVPVVATGRGGPVDLVDSSRTGWLYRPGDLDDLRARVADLAGDETKRRVFGLAARDAVADRTWSSLGDQLLGHYDAVRVRRGMLPRPRLDATPRWTRYVAVGDSLTEGLCDASRQRAGQWRGWADRLASLIASTGSRGGLDYANLAVRSKRIGEVVADQIPRALALEPSLVTVLVGGNDLVRVGARPEPLAAELAAGIARLRASGADVVVVGVFVPGFRGLGPLRARFARFNRALSAHCADLGAAYVDFASSPVLDDPRTFAADRVHLSSIGHRALCYRVATALGIPGAEVVGALDAAVHEDRAEPGERLPTARWLVAHAAPWAGRRMRGKRTGDGLPPKHTAAIHVDSTI